MRVCGLNRNRDYEEEPSGGTAGEKKLGPKSWFVAAQILKPVDANPIQRKYHVYRYWPILRDVKNPAHRDSVGFIAIYVQRKWPSGLFVGT
jgi:hypothetical protein